MQRELANDLSRGASDSTVCLLSCVLWDNSEHYGLDDLRSEPYFIILEDRAETSDDGFEGRESVCGVPYRTEEQFGRSRHIRSPI